MKPIKRLSKEEINNMTVEELREELKKIGKRLKLAKYSDDRNSTFMQLIYYGDEIGYRIVKFDTGEIS